MAATRAWSARRQAPRNGASILDAATELGIRDAQAPPISPAQRHRPRAPSAPSGRPLGDLSDAYLQDDQVRQFRSRSTARGRIAHLTAFFGHAARAAALTTYQIRQYQLARRAAGVATGTTPSTLTGLSE